MKKLNLTRQNHNEPDIDGLERMLKDLALVLFNGDAKGPEWQDALKEILGFQDEDGSFKLIDSFDVESDARVDFCYRPTYLCTAILMKALMYGECEDTKDALALALKACCGRGLSGHGYESFSGKVEAIRIFMEAGLREFLLLYPDLCREFTDMVSSIAAEFAEREEQGDYLADWGADHTAEIKAINEYFSTYNVFVYGTLMKGERNHSYYMGGSKFLGKAVITGFDMYDMGSYPGVVSGRGEVKGELYETPKEALTDLDRLEGEGSLYIRKCVPAVMQNGKAKLALVYVYNHDVDGLDPIPGSLQPYTESWKGHLADHVWYVSYGSNMLRKRFMCYIKGGQYEGGGACHEPCSDTSDPIAVTSYDIPYDMYFRNRSGSWDGGGVSFLDIEKPGRALGVAYLITREQFRHVACQENGGCPPEQSSWYNTIVSLGSLDGCEAVTITNGVAENFNAPGDRYLRTLHKGISENYPDMSSEDIDCYLQSCTR